MKSRWLINLSLLLAIGVLLLVAYFEPGIEQQAEPLAITGLSQDEVHRIHLNRPVRDDLVMVRAAVRRWIIEQTPELPADDFQVSTLLRLAEQQAVRSYPATDLDLGKLQLDPPYATVILNDTPIEFGNLEPLEGLRYVRVADQVHLIPDLYLQLIEASFTQFVRRRLFDENTRISRIVFEDFSVAETDQGWSVEPQQDVSADDVRRFVADWQEATALHVQAAESPLEGETVEVSRAESAERLTFMVAAREPELVLVRPDLGIQYRMGEMSGSLLSVSGPEPGDPE